MLFIGLREAQARKGLSRSGRQQAGERMQAAGFTAGNPGMWTVEVYFGNQVFSSSTVMAEIQDNKTY